jgi:hypothetical protein
VNQSILFPDDQHWDEQKGVVTFPAQSQGALIKCVISKPYLERLAGHDIEDKDVLTVFSQFRFDIEEEAEALIEDEMFSSSGTIELID